MAEGRKQLRVALDLAATILVIAVCSAYLWDRARALSSDAATGLCSGTPAAPVEAPLPKDPVPIGDSPTRGTATAGVALLEYSDFECPFSRRFTSQTLPTIEHEYIDTGRVRLVFRYDPLEAIHPHAFAAARAAACAARQGRFWGLHDRIFAGAAALDGGTLEADATGLGMDTAMFNACLAGNDRDRINRDQAEAKRVGVTGTPGFLVGPIQAGGLVHVTRRLVGALPVSVFRSALDDALAATKQRPGRLHAR
jgi:protein-disulfide isomerase